MLIKTTLLILILRRTCAYLVRVAFHSRTLPPPLLFQLTAFTEPQLKMKASPLFLPLLRELILPFATLFIPLNAHAFFVTPSAHPLW